MVTGMATRRASLGLLAFVLLVCAAVPAAAAPRAHSVPRVTLSAEGAGTLISLRYGASHIHLVHARVALERVALADVDRDGDEDIVAVPREGVLLVWRNAGHGRFARDAAPGAGHRVLAQGPSIGLVRETEDAWQLGDDRYDAAMPRAPDLIADAPVFLVRVTSPVYVRPASFRRSCGRAPPLL